VSSRVDGVRLRGKDTKQEATSRRSFLQRVLATEVREAIRHPAQSMVERVDELTARLYQLEDLKSDLLAQLKTKGANA